MVGSREGVKRDAVFLGGLVVIVVALVVYLIMQSRDTSALAAESMAPSTAATNAGSGASTAADSASLSVARRIANDPLAQGNTEAPVVMVMFADYRCPFCAKFSRDTEPELVQRFVEQGTLRLEWRDFPIFGDQSMLAARAGRAAAEQGKFWEFNQAVFAAAPERGHADLTEDALIGFARQAGVSDVEDFSADMRGSSFDAAIDADLVQATSIGVPSTPAFVINDVPMLGAQPTEDFVRAIDDAVHEP